MITDYNCLQSAIELKVGKKRSIEEVKKYLEVSIYIKKYFIQNLKSLTWLFSLQNIVSDLLSFWAEYVRDTDNSTSWLNLLSKNSLRKTAF